MLCTAGIMHFPGKMSLFCKVKVNLNNFCNVTYFAGFCVISIMCNLYNFCLVRNTLFTFFKNFCGQLCKTFGKVLVTLYLHDFRKWCYIHWVFYEYCFMAVLNQGSIDLLELWTSFALQRFQCCKTSLKLMSALKTLFKSSGFTSVS